MDFKLITYYFFIYLVFINGSLKVFNHTYLLWLIFKVQLKASCRNKGSVETYILLCMIIFGMVCMKRKHHIRILMFILSVVFLDIA